MPHVVRRQYLHVEVHGAEADGLALQRSLPELCHHQVMPAIEQALDRCVPPNIQWAIERLDIDVGTLPRERLQHDLAELVARAIERSIREQSPPAGSPAALAAGRITQHTPQQVLNDALCYFLKTGSLPWSFHLPQGSSLEHTILRSWREAALSYEVLRATLVSETARKRVIRQFSPVFWEALLSLLAPGDRPAMGEIQRVLRDAGTPSHEVKVFEQQLWDTAFAHAARGDALLAREIVREAWQTLSATTTASATLARLVQRHWPGATATDSATVDQTQGASSVSALLAQEGAPAHQKRDHHETRKGRPLSGLRSPTRAQGGHPDAKEGLYIRNAGLVLLHPFVPQLFRALGIAADDMLIHPDRALSLLHFLATGQTSAPEYELVFPKILCDMPLDMPVESNADVTSAEQEEATALLEAVIRHWDVLRNTSPDGLRGTFLLRAGRVSLREGGDWLLQVESHTVDILLDQLPWGIAMVKLPWMKQLLWVEWLP